jgi:hypothetical protein
MNRPLEVLIFLGSIFVAGCLQSYVIHSVRAGTQNPSAVIDTVQLTAKVVLPPQ